MKKTLLLSFFAVALLTSCNSDRKIVDTLNEYNISMEEKGYHFGDKINIPTDVLDQTESISISFGDKESDAMVIDPKFFLLGENYVTFNIKKKNGEVLTQEATVTVFAKNPEQSIGYEVVAEYPHDRTSFTEGFFLEGNTMYESAGQEGKSRIVKYPLGSANPAVTTPQDANVFSEGIASFGDKVYQLTYKNRIGFIYDKASLKPLGEFQMPSELVEGWGMTSDGKNLVASDGTKNIYFLDPANPSKVVKRIGVAGNTQAYDKLNELEYYNGFLYANVWHAPYILKIDPENGEVVGKIDFSGIVDKIPLNPDNENVLNGIAFKGDNMLITGKNWEKIYEVKLK